jgi:hypothetical protein
VIRRQRNAWRPLVQPWEARTKGLESGLLTLSKIAGPKNLRAGDYCDFKRCYFTNLSVIGFL